MLDITSVNSGILIPRMTSVQKNAIASPATGLTVYDTTTSSFWFFNGVIWVEITSSATGWLLAGNTLAGTEKLGSTNAQPVRFYSNNIERARLLSAGQFAVNSTVTFAASTFFSQATGNNDAVDGNAAGTGVAVYGQNSGTGTGVEGVSSNATGFAMWGININASGTAIGGSGNNLGLAYLSTGSGGAFNGTTNGLYSKATAGAGNGAMLVGNNSINNYLLAGSGVAATGTQFGVFGYAANLGNGNAGGYFSNGAGSFVYVGFTNAGINYKVNGNGSVATMVKNTRNENVSLFCPEAPEILFQDFGQGQLVNGTAHIDLDADFIKNIAVSEKHPLRVIVQLEGDCKGVYVYNKSASGFDVKELSGGSSNVPFTWFVTANRANELDEAGNIISHNANARFPLTSGSQQMGTATSVQKEPVQLRDTNSNNEKH
jgi:hypothetical protein